MTMIDPKMITTALELPGHRVTRSFGVVRGIVVRSRSIIGAFGASLQTLFGGNIALFTDMCERARADAHQLMVETHGQARGTSSAPVGRNPEQETPARAGARVEGSSTPPARRQRDHRRVDCAPLTGEKI